MKNTLANDLKKEFEYVLDIEPIDFNNIINDFDTAMIAQILTQLPIGKSAAYLQQIESKKRASIISALASLTQIKHDELIKTARVLREQVDLYFNITKFDGLKYSVNILNCIGSESIDILNELSIVDNKIAQKLKHKIGTLEDILCLNKDMRRDLILNVEPSDLALAFFKSKHKEKEKLFEVMSQRAKERFLEEIDIYTNPHDTEIYEAISKIIIRLNHLIESKRTKKN